MCLLYCIAYIRIYGTEVVKQMVLRLFMKQWHHLILLQRGMLHLVTRCTEFSLNTVQQLANGLFALMDKYVHSSHKHSAFPCCRMQCHVSTLQLLTVEALHLCIEFDVFICLLVTLHAHKPSIFLNAHPQQIYSI